MTEGTRDVEEVLGSLVTLNTGFKDGAVETFCKSTELAN